jgi:hypothetical protein
MAKNSFKRTKSGFNYSGDLTECIAAARAKIERLKKDTPYIVRRFTDEKKRYNAHFKAISDATEFIDIATEHIGKENKTQEANNEQNT